MFVTCNLLPMGSEQREHGGYRNVYVTWLSSPCPRGHAAPPCSWGLWVRKGRVVGGHLGGTDGPGAKGRAGVEKKEQGLEKKLLTVILPAFYHEPRLWSEAHHPNAGGQEGR